MELRGLLWPFNKSCPLHHQLGTARSSLVCQQELSPPQPTWNCQVFFGLSTRAVPSTTNLELPGLLLPANKSCPLHHQLGTARSSLACQQELSPPPPTWNCQVFFCLPTRAVPSTTNLELPGLLLPANKSCPLHNQLGTGRSSSACQQELSPPQPTWNCQVIVGLSTRAVPSTTNLELPGLLWPVNKSCPLHHQLGTARSSLACQQELSPTNLELPGLLWPANKSCPLHHQLGTARSSLACQQELSPPPPTWNCQVFFGLPTRAVPSTTNLELPGLLWPVNKSCPLHNQPGTARSSSACQQELSPPQPTWNCQVFFCLPTRAVPSTTNLELPGLLRPANKSCPLHNQLGTARSSLACQQELSPPQPTWNCQVFFGLSTRAVPSTTNLELPGLLWPVNKSCHQPTWNCQVFFGLPTRAVPSTTNLELPGLLWPVNKSCPLHHQLGTARSSLACRQELSPPQPTWNCQVFFGLSTRAVPSTTNLELPGLLRPVNKSCPLHNQLGTARFSLACQQELSPPQPIWNCQVFFGLPTRAVPSTANLELPGLIL